MTSMHPGTRRSDKDKILNIFSIIDKCYLNSTCTSLVFSSDEEAWLREGLYHSEVLSKLKNNESFESNRKAIEFLYYDIRWSAQRFGFYKNSTISVQNNVLIIPIDISILALDYQTFIDDLEKTWSVFGLKIKISNSNAGYKVKISNEPGERAYVSHREKLMQLYAPARFSTVEHEFGHIIGLRDTYYTSYDQSTCEYVDDYNEGDIMSDSGGKVLQHHIDKIKQAYQVQ